MCPILVRGRKMCCNAEKSLPPLPPCSLLEVGMGHFSALLRYLCSYPDTLIAAKLLGVDLIYFMLMTFKTLQSIFTEIVIFPRYALYKYFSILQCLGPPCSPVCGGGGMDDGRVWATKLAATD